MFDKLFKSKMVQNAMLGKLKDIVQSEGLRCIVLMVKEDGSFEPILFKHDVKIIDLSEYNKLIDSIKSQL